SMADHLGPPTGSALSAFVVARLRSLKLSQTEAERRAGFHRGFIGDLIRGQKKSVHGHNVDKLAYVLEVRIADILKTISNTDFVEGSPSLSGADESLPRANLDQVKPLPAEHFTFEFSRNHWVIPRSAVKPFVDDSSSQITIFSVSSDAMEP